MTITAQLSTSRFFAMMMIGIGLILTGTVLYGISNKTSISNQDFSTVPVQVDYPAPELTLTDLEGNSVSLSDDFGSVVLVNLWATWCPPCKEEMPTLQVFYEKYRMDGFVLIAIDQEEPLEIVEPFVEEFGLTFPVWLDEEYQAQRLFNTMSLPSSYVIDRKGRVRLMWLGGISKENLEKYVSLIIME